MKAKVTRHEDYSVSLRLRRHGDGSDDPSMDDVVGSLQSAAGQMDVMALKFPHDAEGYRRLSVRYTALAAELWRACTGDPQQHSQVS